MKNRIIQVAAQAMNERGIKFTVDSIAQRMGISKKTLYQYVSTKDELVHLVVNAAIQDVEAQQNQILHSDRRLLEKLTAVLTVQPQLYGRINDWVFEDIKNFCPSAWADIEAFRCSRTQMLVDLLDAGQVSGEIRPINSRLAAQALRGALREMIEYGFLSAANLTLQDALAGCINLFIHGILAEPGQTAATTDRGVQNRD